MAGICGVAKDLVVYPGGQSQFSALLEVNASFDRVAQAISFAREHPDQPLTVEQLAQKANPSPRQFARIFPEETNCTPAKVVAQLRVEAARIRVEDNRSESLEEIARATGFNDLERMWRAFLARSTSPRRACVESQRWKK